MKTVVKILIMFEEYKVAQKIKGSTIPKKHD